MPFKGNDFQHTRSEAYAALTYDKYGQEHDEAVGNLVNVENGVRKYWADQLRALSIPTTLDLDTVAAIAGLLDPYSGDDGGNNEFARTALDDRPEGAKHITPNDED
jgi:hypothetical protein